MQISQTADNGPLVQADSWREEYYQGGALALKQLVAPGRPGLAHDPKIVEPLVALGVFSERLAIGINRESFLATWGVRY